ncbi:MAG: glutamate--tRNA ligase family protein [Limisphaerales bacterium]
MNFGIAHEFGGVCNLRMDDTNPAKEEIEYVESIQADVNWLLSGWAENNPWFENQGSDTQKPFPATANATFTSNPLLVVRAVLCPPTARTE